jgi:hypothetical protein
MSEEAKKGPAAPEFFIKGGGTATSRSESLYEQRYREAEERRDQSDRDKAMAEEPASPDQASGLLTNQFTRHPEIPKAFILLTYLDRFGQEVVINNETVACCADLIVGLNPVQPSELSLMIVCPRCQQQSHKHQQDNQILIRQSNKYFEFVAGKGPSSFVFQGKRFKSAGMIVQSEKFSCHDCGWTARIDNNRVWPD